MAEKVFKVRGQRSWS